MSHIETGKSSKTSKASARVKHAPPHIQKGMATVVELVKNLKQYCTRHGFCPPGTDHVLAEIHNFERFREALRFLKKENPLYVTDSDTDYYSDIPELVPFDHVEVQKRGTLHHHAFWPSGTSSSSDDDESSGSESDLPDLVHVVAV